MSKVMDLLGRMRQTSEHPFVPFYFDGNKWFDVVDGPEKWWSLLQSYDGDIDLLLGRACMAPQSEVDALPEEYHVGQARDVRSGRLPSFGFRREHTSKVTLGEWASNRGMDLRALAKKRPRS